MPTTTVEEAQAHLGTWIAKLKPGEELIIVERDRPVARLVAEPEASLKPRQPGSAIGKFTIHKEDDAHLEDFREYMP